MTMSSTSADSTPDGARRRRQQLRAGYRALTAALPAPMASFTDLHTAVMEDGELDGAQKELIAIGISLCHPCRDCVTIHVHDALRAGATPGQVREAIAVAVLMGGGPASIEAAEALADLEEVAAR